MHNGFVNINNEKMSKSLQNFKTLRYVSKLLPCGFIDLFCVHTANVMYRRDIVATPVDARIFRYMIVTAQVNF